MGLTDNLLVDYLLFIDKKSGGVYKQEIEKYLTPFFSFCNKNNLPITSQTITTPVILSFFYEEIEKGDGEEGRQKAFEALSNFFEWITTEYVWPINPMKGLTYPRLSEDRKYYYMRKAEELREEKMTAPADLFLDTGILLSYSTKARKYPRVPFTVPITFSCRNDQENYYAEGVDIGQGGLGMKTNSSLYKGALITISFNIPGVAKPIVIENAEVLYINYMNINFKKSGVPFFIGIRFGKLDLEIEKYIIDYVQKYMVIEERRRRENEEDV